MAVDESWYLRNIFTITKKCTSWFQCHSQYRLLIAECRVMSSKQNEEYIREKKRKEKKRDYAWMIASLTCWWVLCRILSCTKRYETLIIIQIVMWSWNVSFTRFTATDFALKSLMRREETRRDETRWDNWTEERRGLSPCHYSLPISHLSHPSLIDRINVHLLYTDMTRS